MHVRPRQMNRQTNIVAIARRFVLTNVSRAKNKLVRTVIDRKITTSLASKHWRQRIWAGGVKPHKMSFSPHRKTDWSRIEVWVVRKFFNFDYVCSQDLWTMSENSPLEAIGELSSFRPLGLQSPNSGASNPLLTMDGRSTRTSDTVKHTSHCLGRTWGHDLTLWPCVVRIL